MKPIFDEKGTAVAFKQAEDLFALDGTHIAAFDGEWLVNHAGKSIGHFASGWIRDLDGDCVAFMDGASGGPMTPSTRIAPMPPAPGLTPMLCIPGINPVAPLPSVKWSPTGWRGLKKKMSDG